MFYNLYLQAQFIDSRRYTREYRNLVLVVIFGSVASFDFRLQYSMGHWLHVNNFKPIANTTFTLFRKSCF